VIRVRLTAWYVVLLALILSAFSAYLYFSFTRDLHEELQRALASEADRLIANIELESGEPQFGEGSETLPPGMLATLHDPAGNLLEAADPRQAEPETANGWAVLSRPVVIDGVELGVLTVARSEADIEAAVHARVSRSAGMRLLRSVVDRSGSGPPATALAIATSA